MLKSLFESKGYRVTHNLKARGRSGTEHQIDLFLEYEEPLRTSRTVVEAKAYDKPVDKDRVMKLIQIVEDVGADSGILVTTSRFTPGALSIARGRNIDIWDRERLTSLMGELKLSALGDQPVAEFAPSISVVQPVLSIEDAQNQGQAQVEMLAKGGFLGAGKVIETLEKAELLLYPFFEVTAKVRVRHVEKTGLLSKREVATEAPVTVSFDAISGELVVASDEGVGFPFSHLPMLSAEELRVLKSVPSSFALNVIVGLGYSAYKARGIVSGLSGKGLLQTVVSGRYTHYKLTVKFPSDPTTLPSISSCHKPQDELPSEATRVPPRIDAGTAAKTVEDYWGGNVASVSTVYYPFYLLQYRTSDGGIRYEYLDALTGKANQILAKKRVLKTSKV